jgi:putative hydrolase of the HAD superfamily
LTEPKFSLPNAIRAIFFDAVGTLICPEPSAIDVYAAVGRSFGSRLDHAAIKARFRAAFRRQEDYDREHGYRTNDEREGLRWRTIVAEVLDDVTDAGTCFRALFAHFANPAAWRCVEEAESVLRDLSEKGYRLGLASNFDKRLHAVVDGLPQLRWLGSRVVSAEVGYRKPHVRFFEKVCEASDAEPGQILLVGDDFANDYEGAVAAGLSAVLYDPASDCVGRSVNRVFALQELRELLPPLDQPG